MSGLLMHPPLILPCKHCQEPIQRAADPPHDWVHSDDYVTLTWKFHTGEIPDFIITPMTYDHSPEPDVIEAESPQKTLPRRRRKR